MTGVRERIEERAATVAVIGVGYVGLPLACHFTKAGFRVVGFDIDEDRMKSLQRGDSYIDDIDDKRLERALDNDFVPTSDPEKLSEADAFIVAVPTGIQEGEPDMEAIRQASQTIAEHAPDREILYVCSSTVFPGAADEIVRPALQAGGRRPGEDTLVAVVPERINPGGRYEFEDIPLIVGADSDIERTTAQKLFNAVTVGTAPVTSTKAAEMAKTLENTYRMVNIALVNELARHAEEVDVDIWEVINAAGTKPFGFQEFYPGPGVGGHCIPVDPQFLTWLGRREGNPLRLVEQANAINETMPAHVVDQVETGLGARGVPIDDASIVVLGLTYKPNVSDIRNSPAMAICENLCAKNATLTAIDPYVDSTTLANDPIEPENEIDRELIADADVTLLLVDHDVFEYDALEDAPFVFDAQNALPTETAMPVLRLGDGESLSDAHSRPASSATSSTTFQS
ncbi:nucleotide sugar dehydrogenase [Natrinema ejinorense]|uniref:UDP-N-acetyl-D-mannosamine dehydrogenase n=1 Tax=Natrinema ejinorense TaxID=373386 RepID=A0A2A5QUG7_9EURY|nr:nucleotide sugar dehydrogenase [Natrinema ejinorense]PCR90465.1 UDP-N-acetyl-D-glucosamine dehydrogenase [Natrinema ejinorense]